MSFLLIVLFLFFVGSIFGWLLELVWRKFFSSSNPEHKWINPGFLTGPYLPLYGGSLVILYLLTFIDVSFVSNPVLKKLTLFCFMAVAITLFEYIAGLIFIRGMKVKLWDYSKCWGNFQGIICPLYSFFWYLLSAFYYFIIHPKILNWLFWFGSHLEFCLVIGFFYGIFFMDVCYSFNVMARIRKFAAENHTVFKLEHLRQSIRKINHDTNGKMHFWLTMKTEKTTLTEHLKEFFEKYEKKLKPEEKESEQ